MGVREDGIELTGTDLERGLLQIEEAGGGIVGMTPEGKWKVGYLPSNGEYYELSPNGTLEHQFKDGRRIQVRGPKRR